MISKKIISLYGAESQEIGEKREIQDGPLYDKDHVLRLLDEEEIVVWTRKCLRDLQRWEIDLEDVAELIKTALDKGIFWVLNGVNRKETARGLLATPTGSFGQNGAM